MCIFSQKGWVFVGMNGYKWFIKLYGYIVLYVLYVLYVWYTVGCLGYPFKPKTETNIGI